MPNQVIKKVKLPSGTVVDIHDSRIPGVDSVVTSGSDNVVESGAVWDALQDKSTIIKIDLNGAEGIDGDTYTKLAAYAGYEGTQEGLDVFLWDDIEYQQECGRLLRVTAAYSKYSPDGTHFSSENILVLYAKWKYEEEIFVYISTNVNYTTHLHDFIYTRKPLMPEPQKDVKVIVGNCIPEHPRPGSIYMFRDWRYKFKFICAGLDRGQMANYVYSVVREKIYPIGYYGPEISPSYINMQALYGHKGNYDTFGKCFEYSHQLSTWISDGSNIISSLEGRFRNWDFGRDICVIYFYINQPEWAKKWSKEDQQYKPRAANAFKILRDGSWYPMRILNAKTTTPDVKVITCDDDLKIICNRSFNTRRPPEWNNILGVSTTSSCGKVIYYWRTKPVNKGKLIKRWVRWNAKYWEYNNEYERSAPYIINKHGTTYLSWRTKQGGSEGGKIKLRPCKAYLLVKKQYKSCVPIQ